MLVSHWVSGYVKVGFITGRIHVVGSSGIVDFGWGDDYPSSMTYRSNAGAHFGVTQERSRPIVVAGV